MTTSSPRYCIDTCSLTEIRRVYPLDVFPSVWQKLEDLIAHGMMIAAEPVNWELEVQDDELKEWATKNASLFQPLSDELQSEGRRILAAHPTLVDIKKRKSGADAFVVGLASLMSLTVVTQERPSGGPDKEKIPDVCKAIGIECIPVLEMLRREGLRL